VIYKPIECTKVPIAHTQFRHHAKSASKVVDFGTNRKRVYDFLLVINSNIGPILRRFGDTVVYWSKNSQNCQFLSTPVSEIAFARGNPYRIS